MARCNLCHTTSKYISEALGVCLKCLRQRPEDALPRAMAAHHKSRTAFGFPAEPPRAAGGLLCNLCVNECRIPEKGIGSCGLRKNESGKLSGVTATKGKLSWYYDPLPTNCVGDWVCPAGTGAGYPKFAYCPGPETGYKNLAVFFHACTFNCLYCQNWHFRYETFVPQTTSVREFVTAVDDKTACICYFGGDPTAQLPFSIKASELALEKNKGRILRICWETNGSMNEKLLDRMIDLALESGGCIKFDLKAWDDNLHTALTGVTNKRAIANFTHAADKFEIRPVPPLLLASTLLVPGYIDQDEVANIAGFIASINPGIPYSLLAFHPQYYLPDLPSPSKDFAYRCQTIARQAGLERVKIGNIHLLE